MHLELNVYGILSKQDLERWKCSWLAVVISDDGNAGSRKLLSLKTSRSI
jgi:hypothetical protein